VVSTRGRSALLTSLAALLCLQLSCRQAAAPPQPPLRIGFHSDPLSLDPHFRNEIVTFMVLRHIYEPLTRIDARGKVQPGLAEAWLNPDERRWQFVVRANARFHDGRPVEAADVVATFARIRNNPRATLSSYLVEIAEVKALDARTVEIVTARPFPVLLNKLSYILITPAGAPDEITQPIGTGPYIFKGRIPGEKIELVGNRDHWAGPPAIKTVELLTVPEPGQRADLLLGGALDVIQELQPTDFARVEKCVTCRAISHESLLVRYLGLSPREPPFADPRVREAIELAIDRERLVREGAAGHGVPTWQLVGPAVFGYDRAAETPGRDLERAKRLLAEAGYPNGLDLEIHTRLGRPIPQALAEQLGEAGIRANVAFAPWPELFERLSRFEVPVYLGGVVTISSDASDVFDNLIHSRDLARGYGQTNFMQLDEPGIDQLIEQSGTTLDMMKRRAILQEIAAKLSESRVYIGLYSPISLYGLRKDLSWQPRLDGYLLAEEMAWVSSDQAPP
jgi:peptide/nickel transport system substrate-binding protein